MAKGFREDQTNTSMESSISARLTAIEELLQEIKVCVSKKASSPSAMPTEFNICVTSKPFRQTSEKGPMILNSAA